MVGRNHGRKETRSHGVHGADCAKVPCAPRYRVRHGTECATAPIAPRCRSTDGPTAPTGSTRLHPTAPRPHAPSAPRSHTVPRYHGRSHAAPWSHGRSHGPTQLDTYGGGAFRNVIGPIKYNINTTKYHKFKVSRGVCAYDTERQVQHAACAVRATCANCAACATCAACANCAACAACAYALIAPPAPPAPMR